MFTLSLLNDTVQTCDSQRSCVSFLFKPKWWLLHLLKGRRILVADPERSLCQKLKLGKHRSSPLVPYLFSGPLGLCLSCFSGFRDPVQGPVPARQEFSPPAPTYTANPSYKKSFFHWFIYCGRWRSEEAWRSQVAGQARWQHLYMLNISLASLFLMFISLLYEEN